ncbi:hypothetical protein J6590_008817 [Homalodisca vitripennis]|nr:hypothetical protein J6590_008817 [Homalodisca vitripennis]
MKILVRSAQDKKMRFARGGGTPRGVSAIISASIISQYRRPDGRTHIMPAAARPIAFLIIFVSWGPGHKAAILIIPLLNILSNKSIGGPSHERDM